MNIDFKEVEFKLLSSFYSGFHLNIQEIRTIGKELNIEIKYDARDSALKNLFSEANNQGLLEKLINLLINLIDKRVGQYKNLTSQYKAINEVSSEWVSKGEKMKKLLKDLL